jgi:hypothetical protein
VSREDPAQELEAGLRSVGQTVDDARVILAQISDGQEAFALATWFADAFRQLADDAADLRALAVKKIWDAEATSLAGLAEKIGVSKARAGQLMKNARVIEESRPGSTKSIGDT